MEGLVRGDRCDWALWAELAIVKQENYIVNLEEIELLTADKKISECRCVKWW